LRLDLAQFYIDGEYDGWMKFPGRKTIYEVFREPRQILGVESEIAVIVAQRRRLARPQAKSFINRIADPE
jgi:hypothetical protein